MKKFLFFVFLACLFINAAPFTVVSDGLKVNPNSGTILADTDALGADVYESTPINVVVSSSVRVLVEFQHVADDGTTVLHSHTFNVDGSFYCQINQSAIAGEKYRLVLLTTLSSNNSVQGTLSSAGF